MDLLKVKEAAKMMNISKRTLYKWIKEGRNIPRPKAIGGKRGAYRFIKEELEEFIKRL